MAKSAGRILREAEMVKAYPKLVEALRFLVTYEEDSFAGTPQGEPAWLKKYRKLLRDLGEAE